jgi:hypothetical protein
MSGFVRSAQRAILAALSKAKAYALYDGTFGYDVEKYTELLLKAAESVLWFSGYDYARLKVLFPESRSLRV